MTIISQHSTRQNQKSVPGLYLHTTDQTTAPCGLPLLSTPFSYPEGCKRGVIAVLPRAAIPRGQTFGFGEHSRSVLGGLLSLLLKLIECTELLVLQKMVKIVLGGEAIKEVPLDELRVEPFDITYCANLHRYRFIDTDALINGNLLRVIEYAELPERFATISYIWKGNPLLEGHPPPLGSFKVVGADRADPVSIDVIKNACCAALHYKQLLIWLDKVCIAQAIAEDKHWQIQIMGSLYRRADPCIILPGGLSRLLPLEEPTAWVGRAWTLQEALLPRSTKVLFKWKHGDASVQGVIAGDIYEIEPGETAVSEMTTLLEGTIRSSMNVVTYPDGLDKDHVESVVPTHLLGSESPGTGQCFSLRCALWSSSDDPKDLNESAIWKSAVMRTSSRAVDMVFSIMALFDVQLDTSKFHEDDRRGATIALIQELMRSGRRASWMIVSLALRPDHVISTMPVMPKTSVEGVAQIENDGKLVPVGTVVNEYWWLKDAPTGDVDELGYFKFSVPARMVRKAVEPVHLKTYENGMDGKRFNAYAGGHQWELCGETEVEGPDAVWALQVGVETFFRMGAFGTMTTRTPIVLMIVKKHGEDKYHRIQVAEVPKVFSQGWGTRAFNVGGPDDYKK
ncbi:hypothetical protein C7212DRAFT_348096 [Tuber magnatum]|uniref:Heterokaryon incompatibility domain-containing protein n=1 Tax=Tuber magnatum TaxID=42249 RepID=A0A317SFD0_9PEZI|nr:hypothetical protein C7212DRAFT_348096 [Tuber magnatum]